MFKNFLLILITMIALASVTGCSLFSSDSEEQDTAVAEEEVGEDIEEDVEGTTEETASTDEEATTETAATSDEDEEEVVDEYPDDDYGDEEETAVAKEDKSEEPQKEEETLYVDRSEETPAEEPSTYSESTEPIQDSYDSGASGNEFNGGMVSVKKMKKTPYMASGVLINRLYIARDGDSLRTVAEKVYGDGSSSKDLVSWNSNFRGKDLKVGDKVYYSSARNPQDNSAILLYYEEAGVQPSYHTAKSGESIRRVSQKLLGHESSWKEVWATNEVESKWEMPEGTQLRYWPTGTVAAPVQAQAAAPEPTQPEEEAMPMEEATTTEVAANDAPPVEESQPMEEPPPMDDGAAAGMAQNEAAPPPPPSEATPPPPPPPEAIPTPEANNMAQEGTEGGGLADMMGGENDSMMMAILGGLLLLAAMILVVFIRRGRKKAYG